MNSRRDTLIKYPNALMAMVLSSLGIIVFIFVMISTHNSSSEIVPMQHGTVVPTTSTTNVPTSVSGVQIEKEITTTRPKEIKVQRTTVKPAPVVSISPSPTVVEQSSEPTTTTQLPPPSPQWETPSG